jgi:methyltransferase (TIGR00027 family)
VRLPLLPRELHISDRPSSTAQWTTLGRALELSRPAEQRIVDDPYAPLFLSTPTAVLWHALRAGAPALRAAERSSFAGLATYALCRHRFMDEHMLDALASGAAQVLMLGAGYDSRAYRFADVLDGRPVYEVDLAPISRRKAAIVEAHAARFGPTAVHRVEIDFQVDSLEQRLVESGFAPGAPTYVVWEGVTPYLSSDAVSAALETIATTCGPGTRLALDLWRGAGNAASVVDQAKHAASHVFRLIGEPVTFGVAPERVDGLLGGHGFSVIDLVQAEELADRYSTDERPCESAVYVVAATL